MTIKGKRPRDPVQLAKQVFDIAIGEDGGRTEGRRFSGKRSYRRTAARKSLLIFKLRHYREFPRILLIAPGYTEKSRPWSVLPAQANPPNKVEWSDRFGAISLTFRRSPCNFGRFLLTWGQILVINSRVLPDESGGV